MRSGNSRWKFGSPSRNRIRSVSDLGVLHLVDGLGPGVGRRACVAPVLLHLRVQEVLVDRGELGGQLLVEELDDSRVSLHARDPIERRPTATAPSRARRRAHGGQRRPRSCTGSIAAAGRRRRSGRPDLGDAGRRPAAVCSDLRVGDRVADADEHGRTPLGVRQRPEPGRGKVCLTIPVPAARCRRSRPAQPVRTASAADRRPSSGGSWRTAAASAAQVAVDQRLRAVAQRLLRVRVDVDDDPVGADRDRRPGQRHDQVAPAAGVRRVDDDRQVRQRRARPARPRCRGCCGSPSRRSGCRARTARCRGCRAARRTPPPSATPRSSPSCRA